MKWKKTTVGGKKILEVEKNINETEQSGDLLLPIQGLPCTAQHSCTARSNSKEEKRESEMLG